MVNSNPDSHAARHKRTVLHLALILAGVVGVQVFLRVFAGTRPSMQNVQWWQALARTMAKHGFFNVWTPYPPVFPALFYALHRMAPERAILAIWQAFNVCLLLGQAALIVGIVRRAASESRAHGALLAGFAFIAVMFQPNSLVLLGPWMDQFDYLPAFLLLLGLLLLLKEQTTASALVCGVGIMTKLFPAVLVPAAFAALGWKRGLRYAAIAAAACVLVAAPFLIANGESFLSTYRWSTDRPPWESVWAYVFPGRGTRELLANLPEARNPELIEQRFAIPYHPQDAVRPETAQAPWQSNRVNAITAWLMAAGVAFTALLLAQSRRSGPDGPVPGRVSAGARSVAGAFAASRQPAAASELCRGTLIVLLLLLIFSKGFSSYFVAWAAPLICVMYPGAGGFALCAVLIALGNTELMAVMARSAQVFGDQQSLEHFTRLGSPHVLFWRSIVYREMILIVIAGHQIVRLWNSREVTE